MNINIGMKFFGHYNIVIENEKTKEVRSTGWQSNVILKQAFSAVYTNNTQRLYLVLGAGTTTPTIEDSGLETPVASISGSNRLYGDDLEMVTDYVNKTRNFTHRTKFSAATGAVRGNISEIGISKSSDFNSKTRHMTRALIKDGNGNPTTITLGEFDKVTVYYDYGWVLPLDGLMLDTTFDYKGTSTRAIAKWMDWETPAEDAYNTNVSWQWANNYNEAGKNSYNYYKYGFLPETNDSGGSQLSCGFYTFVLGGPQATAILEEDLSTFGNNANSYPALSGPITSPFSESITDSAASYTKPTIILEAGSYTGNITGLAFCSSSTSYSNIKKYNGFTWGIFFYPPLDKQAADKLTFSNISINFQVV